MIIPDSGYHKQILMLFRKHVFNCYFVIIFNGFQHTVYLEMNSQAIGIKIIL